MKLGEDVFDRTISAIPDSGVPKVTSPMVAPLVAGIFTSIPALGELWGGAVNVPPRIATTMSAIDIKGRIQSSLSHRFLYFRKLLLFLGLQNKLKSDVG
jgi:hypothetical protein